MTLIRALRHRNYRLFFTGLGMMLQLASSNTILQTLVDDDKRGRVMGLHTLAFFGVAPFGSLWVGWAAGRIGAPATLMIGGACVVLGAIAFAVRLPALRRIALPIYERKGVLSKRSNGGH